MEGDEVRMKIVAGCEGYFAPQLARTINQLGRVPTLDEAYDLAVGAGLGCEDCLVVINETDCKFEGDGEVGPLFRETFKQPEFNPRWECGLSDNVEIVKFGS